MSWNITTNVGETVKRFGYLFYFMNPSAHNYEKISDVKDYYKEMTQRDFLLGNLSRDQWLNVPLDARPVLYSPIIEPGTTAWKVTPIFFATVLIEQIIRYLQNKPLWRYNDTISNVSHGILMEISKIPFRGAEVWVYAWIYKNYRLIELPWDSPWTWILCWFVTDFCYYWMHRMIHQVNILWAIHETHHTPEEMMFTSPMRNHIFLLPIHWLTYLPMAFAIPPTTYLVHYQISIIYQYWLHSEIIDKLPAFIEFFLSTPSHHRGHHGRNRRYIDKNFGGFLIIWDRIFGTFEPENKDDKPLYGTTKQMQSFNPLVIQTSHFVTIWNNFKEYKTIGHKLSAIFKGPGWSPGKPWTGQLEDIPEPAPEFEKYDPVLPKWCILYMKLHFSIFLNVYMLFALNLWFLSKVTVFTVGSHLTLSTIAFGFMLDNSSCAVPFELFRCIVYFLAERIVYPEVYMYGPYIILTTYLNRMVFGGSVIMWICLVSYEQLRRLYKEKSL